MSILGSVPAHSFYGVPVTGVRPAGQQAGSTIAPPSGPYLGARGNKCTANEDTCKGNRVADEDFCAGHLRSFQKKQTEALKTEVVDGV
jgi:hypothetical protein